MSDQIGDIKQLRYRVMLALYLPILLYAFSTFDLDKDVVVFEAFEPMLVEGQVEDEGDAASLVEDKGETKKLQIQPEAQKPE